MTLQPQIPPRPDAGYPAPPVPPAPGAADADRPKVTWSWYEGVAVYVVAFVLAGLATLPLVRVLEPETDLTNIILTTVAAVVIIAVLVVWLSMSHRGWRDALWPPRPGTSAREVRAGVVFGIGLYPVMVIVVGGLVALILNAITGEPVEAPEQVGDRLPAVGTALTVLYAVVIAPLGEELFFRGVLFRALRDRHGFWVGAIGSGFGFGLIHYLPGSVANAALLMIVMFFTGMALCFVYERRRTIVAPIAAHVTFNVIGIVLIFGLR